MIRDRAPIKNMGAHGTPHFPLVRVGLGVGSKKTPEGERRAPNLKHYQAMVCTVYMVCTVHTAQLLNMTLAARGRNRTKKWKLKPRNWMSQNVLGLYENNRLKEKTVLQYCRAIKKSCVLYCNWRLDHEKKNENGGPCASDISTPASRTEGTAWTPAAAGTAEEKSWKTVTNQTLEQNPNSVRQVTSERPMKVWVRESRMFRHSCCFGRVNGRGAWRRANTIWQEKKQKKRGNRQN